MIETLIADFALLFVLHIATKFFGFEMDVRWWNVWKVVGWIVVAVALLDAGPVAAFGVFAVIGLIHRLVPVGYCVASGLVIVFIL